MKRNELLAKSLTLGLAVATAATSMSVPGGLLAPETVYAEDATTAGGSETVAESMKLAAMSEDVYKQAYTSWEGRPDSVSDFGDFTFTSSEDNTIKVTGTAKYVKGFKGFNTTVEEQQSGHYVAWQFAVPDTCSGSAIYYLESAPADNVKETLDGHPDKVYKKCDKEVLDVVNGTAYFSVLARVDGVSSRELVIDWDGDGKAPVTYTLDYSGLTLEPETTETGITVDARNIADYIDYTGLQDLALIYNGEERFDDIAEIVGSRDLDVIPKFYIEFMEKGSSELLYDIQNAGTYGVYVEIHGEDNPNYIKTAGPVYIGDVTIDKYTLQKEDIKVDGNTSSYWGRAVKYQNINWGDLLQWDYITVKYKRIKDGKGNPVDGEVLNGDPVNAGTYRIYVDYKGDPNCEDSLDIDTGADIVISPVEKTPIVGQQVVNKDDSNIQTIDLSKTIGELKCDYDKLISAKIGTDSDYLKDLKYENGKITVALDTTKTQGWKGETTAIINVDFGDSFNNYNNVKCEIPVVITDKKVATIEVGIKIGEKVSTLSTYDGTNKVPYLYYTISAGAIKFTGSDAEIVNKLNTQYPQGNWRLNTEITDQYGHKVNDIKNAGTYSVHTTYENGNDGYYGKTTEVIVVNPIEINETKDFAGIVSLDTTPLTYNFEDQTDVIKKRITWNNHLRMNDYGIKISYRRGANEYDAKQAVSEGSYVVEIESYDDNYVTDGYVPLGTVVMNKLALDSLTVTADRRGTLTIKAGDYVIPNDNKVTVEYYQGETKLDAKPTAPGAYKAVVTYVDENLEAGQATGETTFTISGSTSGGSTSGGSSSGGSSAGGGAATTPAQDDKKDDTTKTETKPDGTTVTTTETKAEDGSVQTKIELKNDATGVDATVDVTKDAQGKVTSVTAEATQKSSDQKTEISAATVAQITEAAGTKDVEITTKTVDADGKTVREVTVNASDLTAGKKLKVVAVDPKTGEKTLVNKTTYKVAADGSLVLDDLGDANYEVVTTSEANALSKEVLKTIKPAKPKATVAAGKKARLTLDDALNMDNVAKITYRTSKKSVATVNSNGMITTQKEGKVTIKAIVTLNNGKKKTVRMSLTVKKKK